MGDPASFRKSTTWLLALGLAAWLLMPGPGWAETLKVTQPHQQLYPEPNFAATPITPVPPGAEVSVMERSGDWCRVEYQEKTGWLHRLAFPQPQAAPKLGLPGLLFGAPVRETKSDEVALAGKGFTPEVESAYRTKHPEMKFAQVDQVEAYRLDDAKLQAFIKEGGLQP